VSKDKVRNVQGMVKNIEQPDGKRVIFTEWGGLLTLGHLTLFTLFLNKLRFPSLGK